MGYEYKFALLVADELRKSPHEEHRGLRVSVDPVGNGRWMVRGRARSGELVVVLKGASGGNSAVG